MAYQFTELTAAEFTNFEQQSSAGTYVQSAKQVELLKRRGYQTWTVGVKDGSEVVAAALIMHETVRLGNVLSIDHGPLLDFKQPDLMQFFMAGLIKFAQEHNTLYLEVRPNVTYQLTDDHGAALSPVNDEFMHQMNQLGFVHQPFAEGMSTSGSPEWEYVKDLSAITDVATLHASYDKKALYYLKKNAQFGIKLRYLKRADLPDFKQLTQTTAERLNYHDKNLNFYETAYDVYGDGVTYVFAELNFADYQAEEQKKVAELDQKLTQIQDKITKYPDNDKFKRQYAEFDSQKDAHVKRIEQANAQQGAAGQATVVVAGAMFIQTPQEITYLYSGTYAEYMEYYGPYQIQDAMLTKAVKAGIKRFNFYGIAGKFDGSDGVLGFKTVFGGYARQLVGNFVLPVQPTKYRIYRLLKKIIGR
ncbi:MAG: aminoacyltransferase [Lactobacillaceae bacterium]|nr:aminoacyltransferase [Lactobacillaceae bacterium]